MIIIKKIMKIIATIIGIAIYTLLLSIFGYYTFEISFTKILKITFYFLICTYVVYSLISLYIRMDEVEQKKLV